MPLINAHADPIQRGLCLSLPLFAYLYMRAATAIVSLHMPKSDDISTTPDR